jgi:hypothetical protein
VGDGEEWLVLSANGGEEPSTLLNLIDLAHKKRIRATR